MTEHQKCSTLKPWKDAMKYNYFWSKVLSQMFESKGKIALAYYYTMKEFERWGIEPTEESLRDWHNIGIVGRVSEEVLRI